MNSVLYPIAALTAWVACLYKARDLRRQRNTPLAAVVAAFVCLGGIFFFASPQVWSGFDRLTHYPNLAMLVSQGLVMPFTFCVLAACMLWRYPAERAHRLIRRYGLALTAVVALMAALFLAAPVSAEDPTTFVPDNARNPFINAYLMVYIVTYAVLQIVVVRLTLQLARIGGRPWLRRGLRINAFGNLLALPYCAVRIADVLERWIAISPGRYENVARLAVGIGVLMPPIGWTIPRWGPRLTVVADWARAHRPYWQLYPLWHALTEAVPYVVLDTEGPGWRRGRRPGRVALRAGYRLTRRYVEIRDSRLELRPFLDPDIAARAESAGRQAGLGPEQLAAVVEAAQLAAVLRARSLGIELPRSERDPSSAERPDTDPGGADAAAEIAWLTRVAAALTGSPVVASVLADTDPRSDAHPAPQPAAG
ncbi:MAB_1171c family putative transporter [Streptacidiphilus sp. EB129]|uniref:MAB_1171c family putative transporter n=1 Tax=Streptacidiphilus sp. EB129 TaxID=3156262 RepID=UPI003519278F